jgi:hypothetical protein
MIDSKTVELLTRPENQSCRFLEWTETRKGRSFDGEDLETVIRCSAPVSVCIAIARKKYAPMGSSHLTDVDILSMFVQSSTVSVVVPYGDGSACKHEPMRKEPS